MPVRSFSSLIVASRFASEGSPEALKAALREVFQLTIFRNEHYNVYEEYERLFSDFKVPKIKFKLSKFKDIFKVGSAYTHARDNHARACTWRITQIRTLARTPAVTTSASVLRFLLVVA